MNKNYTVFLIFVLLCADIFCVPSFDDISSSISNAWQEMITAIKKPGRKRAGRIGRRRFNKKLKAKSNSTTRSTTTTDAPTTSDSMFIRKLSLPVLPYPQWTSLDNNWKMPQHPGTGIILNVPLSISDYL